MTPDHLPVNLRYLEGTDNRALDLVVVIPVARCEWHLAVKLLGWLDYIDGEKSYPLIVYCAPSVTKEERDQLFVAAAMRDDMKIVSASFKDPGYFGGANLMFKGALDYCEANRPGKAMLWVEADCVPMRATWLDEIIDEYRGCGSPFLGDVHLCELNHMTGNAVWHPNWRNIAPSLAELPGPDMEWGWDSSCADDTFTRCRKSKRIQQIWRPPLPITKEWAAANIRSGTALFHQCKDSSLIDVLCVRNNLSPIPLPQQLEPSTYAQGRKQTDSLESRRLRSPGARMVAGFPMQAQVPTTSIFIVSYAKDIEFLKYLLKSIQQNASGFHEVVVAVPSHEKGQYGWVKKARVEYFEEVPGKGMLSHMVQKCYADEYCPDAQCVWHLDSDCLVWSKVTPADLYKDGKPVLLRERYADLRNNNRRVWQKCVENALGFKPEYEGMVRQGALHLREVYAATRKAVEKHTGSTLDDHFESGPNAFPQSACEFNTLAAIAIRDFRNRYEMIDYDWERDAREAGLPKDTAFQYLYKRGRDPIVETWSHGTIAMYKSDLEGWLRGSIPAYWLK